MLSRLKRKDTFGPRPDQDFKYLSQISFEFWLKICSPSSPRPRQDQVKMPLSLKQRGWVSINSSRTTLGFSSVLGTFQVWPHLSEAISKVANQETPLSARPRSNTVVVAPSLRRLITSCQRHLQEEPLAEAAAIWVEIADDLMLFCWGGSSYFCFHLRLVLCHCEPPSLKTVNAAFVPVEVQQAGNVTHETERLSALIEWNQIFIYFFDDDSIGS